MPAPIITIFGFTTRSGALANLVDNDAVVGWAPQPTRLSSMNAPFVNTGGAPNIGNDFAAIQVDFGTPTRVAIMLIQVQHLFTLGDCMMIASDNPATSVSNTVQSGDISLGLFSRDKMVSNKVISTLAKTQDVTKRYLRFCFHATGAKMTQDGTTTDTGGSMNNGVWYDVGSGVFEVPVYTGAFVTEGWGGGASGGEPGAANNGGETTAGNDSIFMGHAGGGFKATTNPNTNGTPALGGAASGANTDNITGGQGGLPSSFTAALGSSGKGGDSPNGGTGGPAIYNPNSYFLLGADGNGPGGGGSGRNIFTSIAGGTAFKYPGGGAGAYFRDVRTPGDLVPGSHLAWSIGLGGLSPIGNGRGANGRVKFSWT